MVCRHMIRFCSRVQCLTLPALMLFLLPQAVWALGNIAGDSPQCRDLVLQHHALEPLLGQLKENSKISMLRNATWTLSNFCRGKPQPAFEQVGHHRETLIQTMVQAMCVACQFVKRSLQCGWVTSIQNIKLVTAETCLSSSTECAPMRM